MKKINKQGFTLIELLVVIAIIGLLSTIALNSFNAVRSNARDAKRISDLKTIQKAIEMYKLDHDDHLPTATGATSFATQLSDYLPNMPHNVYSLGNSKYYLICKSNSLSSYVLIAHTLDKEPSVKGYPASGSVSMEDCFYYGFNAAGAKDDGITPGNVLNCNALEKKYCLSGSFKP